MSALQHANERVEVVISSEELSAWSRDVIEATERLQYLLENIPRRVEAAVVESKKEG